MLKHVVCFKIKDGESIDKAVEVLKSMEGKVKQIKGIEVGKDQLHSSRSYDIMLTVILEDMEALEEYQRDEYHVNVVKEHMHKVRESSIAIDYEI